MPEQEYQRYDGSGTAGTRQGREGVVGRNRPQLPAALPGRRR
jgi:hypothetical protein